MVRSLDGDTVFFEIVAWVLPDALSQYVVVIYFDYGRRTSLDLRKENVFTFKKKRTKRYHAKTMIDSDYADYLALLANTPSQAKSLLHSLEHAAGGNSLLVNVKKTVHVFHQEGDISNLSGKPLKLVDEVTYLGSNISSTESDVNVRIEKRSVLLTG